MVGKFTLGLGWHNAEGQVRSILLGWAGQASGRLGRASLPTRISAQARSISINQNSVRAEELQTDKPALFNDN